MSKPINVLFLCTGNSARSIISEALLNDLGAPRFQAFSAGSRPSGIPHPDALVQLISQGHVVDAYYSKSWDVFAQPDALIMDIIVTVCGSAASEVCPIWPSRAGREPVTVHWGAEDPAYIEPLEARQKAFAEVYDLCKRRIEALIASPEQDVLDKKHLAGIGRLP